MQDVIRFVAFNLRRWSNIAGHQFVFDSGVSEFQDVRAGGSKTSRRKLLARRVPASSILSENWLQRLEKLCLPIGGSDFRLLLLCDKNFCAKAFLPEIIGEKRKLKNPPDFISLKSEGTNREKILVSSKMLGRNANPNCRSLRFYFAASDRFFIKREISRLQKGSERIAFFGVSGL